MEGDEEKARAFGCDDYVTKPYSLVVLLRLVRRYLGETAQRIKPLLAGVERPSGRAPKVQAPVDQHYVHLREALNRTFETIGLAPA